MTVLVTGATGTVGRQVVEQLVQAGRRVRALTRNPAAAGLPPEVEVVRGDLTDVTTLAPAFAGVTGLHTITFDGDGGPLQNGKEITELAVKAGVERVTVLGGWDRSTLEDALTEAGLGWTHLRCVEFMANARDLADSIRTTGGVERFDLGRPSAMVHEADIAAVAVTALTRNGHAGKAYTLTGPQALTLAEQVGTIAAALGRDIELRVLTEEQAREGMRAAGMPEEYVEFAVELEKNPPEEGKAVLPTVEQVTGRPGRTFAQWVGENLHLFR
ncbi:NAD(P)H-binding protein [Rhizohabitans arisaemae]|uniref:NAD(P)H-binding protein n=1 Tax=Rhizohabitans arisaemae TaxID=2720610 RepID=UPI0024B1AC32|nr:NAD(P)H-binding protein [Rhizohabitans arisaemae]